MRAEKPTVNAIGHGHIDPQWLWGRLEGLDEGRSTFRSANDRMKESPDFKFTASTALIYNHVKEVDPKLFQDIQKRVKEGQWEVAASKWVEPDCNIPSGESQLRQFLYGQRFTYDNFGKITQVNMEPDGFGHNAETAKLAQHAGIDFFTFMRPSRDEMGLPHGPFWLTSNDGSKVLTQRIPFDYNQQAKTMAKHLERVFDQHNGEGKNIILFYGVGNHGGGPTKENIKELKRLKKEQKKLMDIQFSTINKFFTDVQKENKDLPTIRGELQAHAVGCYSVGAEIKQANRKAENNLLIAEKLRSMTHALTEHAYPSGRLTETGKTIAEYQFHDTLGATLPRPILEESVDALKAVSKETKNIAETALGRLAANIKIEHEDDVQPILVANPNTWQSKIAIETEIQNLKSGAHLVDNHGQEIPLQEIKSYTESDGRHRISFMADLPSLGYKTYHLINKESPSSSERMQASDKQMENDRYLIAFDEQTGNIARLYDKKIEAELFNGQASVPTVIKDESDTWSHGIYAFKNKEGQFQIAKPPELIENGKVQSTIRVQSDYGKSTMTQDFTMYKDHDGIKVDVTLDWQEKQKMLKLQFPVNVYHRENTYESPYGTIQRPGDGREVPGQSWVDISGVHRTTKDQLGISIINDGKYSFDTDKDTLSMTVLRSPVYAHHDPRTLNPEKDYEYMDQGTHRFSYMILPHDKSWKEARTPQKAAEFNQPPLSLLTSGSEDGTLSQENSFAEVGADNVMMTVLKKAENSELEAYIVRLHETNHKTTQTTIRVGDRKIPVTMNASGLKSLLVPFDTKAPIFETDATELIKKAFV